MTEKRKPKADELAGKTRKELLALAHQAGIPGFNRLKREELVERLLTISPAEAAASVTPAKGPEKPVVLPDSIASAAPSPPPPSGMRPHGAKGEPSYPTELPETYGVTRLTLLEVDPHHVHAYWEITSEDRQRAVGQLGSTEGGVRWVLRFYDITYIDFNGQNAHSFFDIDVAGMTGNWYVDLWSDDKSYCAEIGPVGAGGKFIPTCRSNIVHTPRSSPSPRYEPRWVHLDPISGEVVAVPLTNDAASPQGREESRPGHIPPETAGPFRSSQSEQGSKDLGWVETSGGASSIPPGAEKPEAQAAGFASDPHPTEEEVREHYRHLPASGAVPADIQSPQPVESTGSFPSSSNSVAGSPPGAESTASSFSAGLQDSLSSFSGSSGGLVRGAGPIIDLELNAEIIIYGRAQPGQMLQVNGCWVKVNPDGTFRVQWALPRIESRE